MRERPWMQTRSRRSIARQLIVETLVFGLCLVALVVAIGLAGPAPEYAR